MSTLDPWPAWPLLGPDGPRSIEDPTFDASAALWTDREPMRSAYDKSLWMLAVLRDAVRGQAIDGGEQFVALADDVLATDDETLRTVWSDPRAYWWTHTAHGLLRDAQEDPARAPDAAAHLAGLALFAAGIAVVSRRDRRFDPPLTTAPSTRVPGTVWSVSGTEVVAVTTVVDGQLIAADGPVPVRSVPVAHVDGYDLLLDPSTFAVPGYDKAEAAVAAGEDYQRQHAALVERTLANISRYAPDEMVRLRDVVRVAALKPFDAGGFDAFSNPELPGSFIAGIVPNPLELGEHMIHELRHNCLSLVEESGALFTVDGDGSTIYYSPWRAKPRRLYGLLHGVYVFISIWHYWRGAADDEALDAPSRAAATDRVVRIAEQLVLGVGVLERHARLTQLGTAILDGLRRAVDTITAEVASLDLSPDPPAYELGPDGAYLPVLGDDGTPITARQVVREHLRRHDTEGRAAGLLPDVEPADRP